MIEPFGFLNTGMVMDKGRHEDSTVGSLLRENDIADKVVQKRDTQGSIEIEYDQDDESLEHRTNTASLVGSDKSGTGSDGCVSSSADDEYDSEEDRAAIIEACARIMQAARSKKMLHAIRDLVESVAGKELESSGCTERLLRYSQQATERPIPIPRFKFPSFEIKAPVQLIYGVSLGNQMQAGRYFQAFIDLVNKNSAMFSRLILVDTTFLNRHYSYRYSNKSQETEWHKAHVDDLDKLQINHEYVTWDFVMNPYRDSSIFASFKEMKMKVLLDYYGDETRKPDPAFVEIIDRVAASVVENGMQTTSKEVATKYLLEECSGVLTFNGICTYPGGFNEAITHVVNKHADNGRLMLLSHKEAKQIKDKRITLK